MALASQDSVRYENGGTRSTNWLVLSRWTTPTLVPPSLAHMEGGLRSKAVAVALQTDSKAQFVRMKVIQRVTIAEIHRVQE